MHYCPQCGGLVETSKKTRTTYEKGKLFKEKRTHSNCIECEYSKNSIDKNHMMDVNEPDKGIG